MNAKKESEETGVHRSSSDERRRHSHLKISSGYGADIDFLIQYHSEDRSNQLLHPEDKECGQREEEFNVVKIMSFIVSSLQDIFSHPTHLLLFSCPLPLFLSVRDRSLSFNYIILMVITPWVYLLIVCVGLFVLFCFLLVFFFFFFFLGGGGG